jgi:uncharacterized membrane protein YqaE (UPF0057 family)
MAGIVLKKSIINRIQSYWDKNPLSVIIWTAILLRFVSVIFARGFGMHDDHFLVVEPPQSWVDGWDYNNYLPDKAGHNHPTGHSFFYNGIQYVIFLFLDFIHVRDPQFKMFFIRLLHAAFSLITVYLGFRITEKLHNESSAKLVGILLAAYWFMPWLSVRNLVEVVSIPFLIMATWAMLVADDHKRRFGYYLLSGFLFGLAFSVRFQTIFFPIGTGLALLIQKKWREAFVMGGGTIIGISMTQGLIDLLIWGYPFAELTEYINYNIQASHDYFIGPWYNYLLIILALLIPPVSFFFFFGFFRRIKQHLTLFLPAALFILFHCYFPNKQERFILPVIPYILILGAIGWKEFIIKSRFRLSNRKLLKTCWIFFWTINLILLPIISTMYSKKARIESMSYLRKYKHIEYVLFDDTFHPDVKMAPDFYYGARLNVFTLCETHPYDSLKAQLKVFGEAKYPRFVLFFDDRDLEKRVDKVKILLPNITYETTIKPGFADWVLFKMNPYNANQTIFIYRNRDFFAEKAGNKRN